MSRGEETDRSITGGDLFVPGESQNPSTPEPSEEGQPEAPPYFAVVITDDGFAAIDGEPVVAAKGETVDAAILDALHRNACALSTSVTASISDPSAGYVALVEVTPDGSSTLLEQHQEEPTSMSAVQEQPSALPTASAVPVPVSPEPAEQLPEEPDEGPVGQDALSEQAALDAEEEAALDAEEAVPDTEQAAPAGPFGLAGSYGFAEEAGASGAEDDFKDDFKDDFTDDLSHEHGDKIGDEANALPQPAGPLLVSPAPRPKPKIIRLRGSRQSDDEYQPPGLLHRPFVVGPVGLLVAALVIIPMVIVGNGSGNKDNTSSSSETTRIPSSKAPAPSNSAPVPTPTLTLPPMPTPTESAIKPTAETKHEKAGGPSGTVTVRPPQVTTTVTSKPPQETAATAVNLLARNDPSERHICYRAYVAGQGWQKPVCDGTTAGTSGKNKPIKALNFAVRGTGGMAANAFVHDSRKTSGVGAWKTPWTAITPEGKNIYIGSTKRDAPNMLGFAIDISSGQICQMARVHNGEFGTPGCAKPRPKYTFGGTLSNDGWLEAVKITV